MPVLAWHFLYEDNKMRCGNVAPADGEWLVFDGEPELCASGLHASLRPFDALQYAPGPILCLVECDDIREQSDDKLVCTRRRIITSMDDSEMLRHYARMEALQALQYAPSLNMDDVVYDWLMTGDESIKSAAYLAARSAAYLAAESAARSAAWSAARSAAVLAAESAARSAAYSAAVSAARSAAWSAARSASADRFDTLVRECFSDFL